MLELGNSIEVSVEILAEKDIASEEIGIGIGFRNQKGLDVIISTTFDAGNRLPALTVGQRVRAPGHYALVVNVEDRGNAIPQYYDFIENVRLFKVVANQPVFSLVAAPVDQIVEVLHG
jgi:hypothetical protein